MIKKQFTTVIDAPKEKVWEALWQDANYREWTSVFAEGSRAETDWQKGSKVYFLDGKGSGMFSRIEDNRPNEFMSIQHLGIVKEGSEDIDSEKVKVWAGAMENYTLTDEGGKTKLVIDIDLAEEWVENMEEVWPKALEKLKAVAERD